MKDVQNEKDARNIYLHQVGIRDLKYPVFAILTRAPSPELSWIHDRMPVILPAERIDEWIRPEGDAGEIVKAAVIDMVYEKAVQ